MAKVGKSKSAAKKIYRYPKITLHDSQLEIAQLIKDINHLLPQQESQTSVVKVALYEKLAKLKQLKIK